jgi:alcohol dehydrogenase class IV
MLPFEFATATRIVFGAGKLRELGSIASHFCRRTMVVTGSSPDRARHLFATLDSANITTVPFAFAGEPTIDHVRQGAELGCSQACDSVVGFGGGSALDAAKAIAALLTNRGQLFDYLEVVGRAQPLKKPAAPCLLVPTTAGTGAEVTRNAVLTSPEHQVKVSLRSAFLLPRVALIDPELSYTLPSCLTACTGLDALTQLIEPFVSPRANPVTDAFCREGLCRVAKSLRRAYANGHDHQARADMALAALLSGLALANAGLGAVHGLAAVLGGACSAPHGSLCAALLPAAMQVNIRALRQRQPSSEALGRYTELARILTGERSATPELGVEWVRNLCSDLRIAPLSHHAVRRDDFQDLVIQASRASSMKANPVVLEPGEAYDILALAY